MKENIKFGLTISALALSGCYGNHLPKMSPIPEINGHKVEIREAPYEGKCSTKQVYDDKLRDYKYLVSCNPIWLNHHVKPSAQLFVLFHEIGHIQLGHVQAEGIYLSKEMKKQVHIDADCYSGKMMRDVYHYTPEQFSEVYDLLRYDHQSPERETALHACLEEMVIER